LKVRPYERSTLWRGAFANRRNDPDARDREALAEAYRQLRERAGDLVGEFHVALPQLTVHDLTHADTLWDVASEICGPELKLNPLAGFVLGASFLLHDAGMALAAYPGGISELKRSVEWRDALVSAWKKRGVDPSDSQRERPDSDVADEATFQVLRERHASQARSLTSALWTQPGTGRPMALVQNDDLLESYGLLIGNIAASHHWPLPEVARYFGDPTPASAAWPREWEVDALMLGCILRCADACAIDETRAPSFLYAIRKPTGYSKRHWNFQNKIYPAKHRDDSLVFESKSSFSPTEADDWWLCFDAIEIADRELRGADALLTDRKRRPLDVRRVVGAGDPEILAKTVTVHSWRPVNTLPRISDPSSVIERLGGKQLYGDDPIVPIRELIQNSVDAIRARRFVDLRFSSVENEKYPGRVSIEITRIQETNEFWVAVEDNGVGMSERTITRSLLDFGTSFWSSPAAAQLYPGLPSEKKFKPVGRFGIGFFSVFMYASTVIVMSREFGAAKNIWNVLSFDGGVRARGNLSVQGMPEEIVNGDASTRIKMRVANEFLHKLGQHLVDEEIEHGELNNGAEAELNLIRNRVTAALRLLVCALDVPVYFRFLDREPVRINDPLIYERDVDTIWSAVLGAVPIDDLAIVERPENQQKDLLTLMGGDEEEFYGVCGVNVGIYPNLLVQSVGGIGTMRYYGEAQPIAGIAEYNVTAANRSPDKLAAPKHVIDQWAKAQMKQITTMPLLSRQREMAIKNLGKLVDDIRPIFGVTTNLGFLDLDSMVAAFEKRGSAILPVQSVRRGPSYSYADVRIPDGPNGLDLEFEDLSFTSFVICPASWDEFPVRWEGEHKLRPTIEPNIYKTIFGTIFNVLRDRKLDFEVLYHRDFVVGSYVGLDSARHGIKAGDDIRSDAVEIKLLRSSSSCG
jgi:Histidine kinase-, DNA gyrase B-, and HSP90-like ATPase